MIPTGDLLQILGYVALTAGLVAMAGLGVLYLVRRRSLLLSVLVVALVAVAAVVAGAMVAAGAMVISTQDLRVLVLIVALAGAAGAATAVVHARHVVRGSRALGRAAAALGDGAYTSPTVPLNAELTALDGQLAEMSHRLEQGRQRERELEASRRELVAWISHDLRTPLAGVRAMSEALEDRVVQDSETVHRYHAGIRREADRLSAMVDDLFELSRINASALHLRLQEVALQDLVSDAVVTAAAVAAAKDVTVRADGPSAPALVLGSVPELGRVLANLLSNAVRCTGPGGVVEVSLSVGPASVTVAVQDACGGISPADLPRVFDVAFRGTAARTPGEDGGAGLGLAIARGLVAAHGGTITLENAGPGCCAVVVLPGLPQPTAQPVTAGH